ncbi:MAG: hypothetical protein WC508_03145 [Patescibacteria group bacterium]
MKSWKMINWLGQILLFWWLDRLMATLFVLLFYPLTRIFCKVKVVGKENFPRSGRIMLIADHPSFIGIFVVVIAIFWPWVLAPGKLSMIPAVLAKTTYKPLWWILALRFNIFGVSPDKRKRSQAVRAVINYLNSRINCVLLNFAAGTRNEAGQEGLPQVNPGVGRTLVETEPLLVLVNDVGSGKVWPKGKMFPGWQWRKWHGISIPCRTEVTIYISKPLDTAADPESGIFKVSSGKPFDECGQPVADYLRLLFEVWRVSHQSINQAAEIPGYEKVVYDLCLL